MSSRTTSSFVTFLYPSMIGGYTGELSAGEYEVLADDNVVLSAQSATNRRTATFPLINWHTGKPELRAVKQEVLALDQTNVNITAIQDSEAALSPSEDRK